MPVMVAVIAPCCRRSMACCFFYNRIFIRDLGRAVFIREPLFAGGADPIRRVAIFRAGHILCGNGSQRVADCDLRRGNDRGNISKRFCSQAFLKKSVVNGNALRIGVTFQDFKCKREQDSLICFDIDSFRRIQDIFNNSATIFFSVVFIDNRIHIDYCTRILDIVNFKFLTIHYFSV